MVRHWQVTAVTQISGVIKYSVSDSVEEKGTIVNRKKPSVHVWSVCEGLAIIHEESKLRRTNKQLYGYISIVYFDENLTSSCNLFYGMCTRDRPQDIWDFPVVI